MPHPAGNVSIVLAWHSQANITGFSGPGWYLAVADSGLEGSDWLMKPQKITPAEAVAIAIAVDNTLETTGLLDVVSAANHLGLERLRDRVRRLEATERELASARAELAAFVEAAEAAD